MKIKLINIRKIIILLIIIGIILEVIHIINLNIKHKYAQEKLIGVKSDMVEASSYYNISKEIEILHPKEKKAYVGDTITFPKEVLLKDASNNNKYKKQVYFPVAAITFTEIGKYIYYGNIAGENKELEIVINVEENLKQDDTGGEAEDNSMTEEDLRLDGLNGESSENESSDELSIDNSHEIGYKSEEKEKKKSKKNNKRSAKKKI